MRREKEGKKMGNGGDKTYEYIDILAHRPVCVGFCYLLERCAGIEVLRRHGL